MYLVILAALNVFDCVSTWTLILNGVQEGNLVVQLAIDHFGLAGIPLAKIIPLAMIVIIGVKWPSRFVNRLTLGACIIYAIVMFTINLPLLIFVFFF